MLATKAVGAGTSVSAHIQRAIERCSTKYALTRDESIVQAVEYGFPVVPYKCPNGWDHWHIGKSHRQAKIFYSNRPRWESRWINKSDTIPGACPKPKTALEDEGWLHQSDEEC